MVSFCNYFLLNGPIFRVSRYDLQIILIIRTPLKHDLGESTRYGCKVEATARRIPENTKTRKKLKIEGN